MTDRLQRLERGGATDPQEQERAIDRETFRRMSTEDLLALEETFQRVEDLGDEPAEEEWAAFEAAGDRFFKLRGEVRQEGDVSR
jgi:hypothetical protein